MKSCRFGLLLLSAVVGGLFVGVNESSAAAAGCFVGPARLDDAALNNFLGAPDKLLTDNPAGGLALASQVRDLVGSSADSLPKIQPLLSGANAMQKSAIGAGLARAARACQRSAPDYAQQIQAMVASSAAPELIAAFVGALNEVQTAALGGGAASGAAAGGIANSGPGNGTSGPGSDSPLTVSTSAQTVTFSSGRTVGTVSDDTATGGGVISVSQSGGTAG